MLYRYETSTEQTMTLAVVDGVLKPSVQKSNEGEKSKNVTLMRKKVLVQLLVEVGTGKRQKMPLRNRHVNVNGHQTMKGRGGEKPGRRLRRLITMLSVCERWLWLHCAVRLYMMCYNTLVMTTPVRETLHEEQKI